MTSPSYDSGALAAMYDSAGALQLKEIEQRYKLGKSDIAARLKIASQQSKDTRYGIDAQRDTAREQIAQARAEMEQIGVPRMLIDKFVAEKNYEVAQAELTLKRDMFVEETAQAKAKLQLDREQMERVGIPQMEINKYVAEQNARIQQAQQTGYFNGAATLDRQKFQSDADYQRAQLAQSAREFQTTASGYMQQQGTLAQDQRLRYEQIKMADQQGTASAEDRAELAGYEDILSGRAGGQGQRTLQGEELDRQYQLDVQRFGADEAERLRAENERQRRYALDVSKLGADLASTPDTYFQARRFQGVDVPRLLGGAGAATQDVQGGPTPGVATMGAYLSGQDPYGGGAASVYGGPSVGASVGPQGYAQQPAPSGPSPYPSDDPRQKQLAQIAKASPPSPYDGLNEQDASTLKLMESIYKKGGQGIAGGEYERLKASGRLGFLQSAGKMLGYSPSDLESQYQGYRPSQGSASLAG